MELAYTGTNLIDLPASFTRDDLAKSSVPLESTSGMCEARKINWAAISFYEPHFRDSEIT